MPSSYTPKQKRNAGNGQISTERKPGDPIEDNPRPHRRNNRNERLIRGGFLRVRVADKGSGRGHLRVPESCARRRAQVRAPTGSRQARDAGN